MSGELLRTILTAALYVYWAAAVVFIISLNRGPAKSFAWIVTLILLPGFGLVIYILAGRNWKAITPKRAWYRDLLDIQVPFMHGFYSDYASFADSVKANYAGTPGERVMDAIEKENFGAVPLPATDLAIYPSGAEYFSALIEDISKAQRFIHMQYFIWGRDELTTQVCDALMKRLEAGVEVRILNDFVGNISYKKDQIKALQQAGAHYGADVKQLSKLNYRNHRKITVIDGRVGHTGGVNIAQEYIDGGDKYPSWRDTGLRFTGPAVAELQKLFAYRWYEVFAESLFTPAYFPAEDLLRADGLLPLQVVAQGVSDYWSSATRAHQIAISAASERVWLQSPYWIPTEGLMDSVVNAALAGVDVRLMMSGWPDKKITLRTARTFWERLIRAGGHVHLYQAGFFHAKSIVVDGKIGAVGTMNLDTRSLQLHQELMVWMYADALAKRQEDIFRADLEQCTEVTLQEIESWSAFSRFGDSVASLASSLM